MLTVDIATPTKKVADGVKVDWVKVPGARGELQILPGHADLLTILGTGPLTFMQDGKERKFAVSYGFAEVRKNKVIVLAETIEEAHEIDKSRVTTAKKKSEEALSAVLTREEFRKHQAKLQRAIVRQHISG
jgi:F-type H+-transporting ATPase subunit epsilon